MSAEAISRLAARLRLVVVMSVVLQLFFAGRARANGVSDWTCTHIPFADKVCSVVEDTNKTVDFVKDPLGYIAQFFNNAVTTILGEMIKALLSTTTIDWSNAGFIRTYAMAFAASTMLTVFLWLIAVAKRALQGVPPLQALSESIGFLLLSVVVTALAPAAVASVTQLFDMAAAAMFAPVASDAGSLAGTITVAMGGLMVIPGGQIIVIFLALAMLSAVAGVWIELIIRDALILSGLVFGATVFSGLVDRNLWGHCKKWVGVMAGIIASKYITFTTLALGTGLLTQSGTGPPSVGQSFATVFTGIGLMWMALYLPFTLAKFLPFVGDELQAMYSAKEDFKGRAQNAGGKVGDTFGELKDRLGSKDGEGEGGAGAAEGVTESGSETGAAELGASATGVGAAAVAAEKGIDTVKDETKDAAERGASNATGGEGAAADTSSGQGGEGANSGPEPAPPAGGTETAPSASPNRAEQPESATPEPTDEESPS
ncbi:hypothetical protein ACEZDB_32365 [Streptacidiphilus sp. N1-3]|uniref:TrbL/VirB6 plasmid conjugal transfer protein n=1 Tax=Streptacidiphilus alkalitolerans TaxID=3342712 RepID=A0ABV6XAQ3_9ACTN